MKLFPNPASSELNISINPEQKQISTIRLFDVTGRTAEEITQINAFTKIISVSNMNSGLYLLYIQLTDGSTATQRVVIER